MDTKGGFMTYLEREIEKFKKELLDFKCPIQSIENCKKMNEKCEQCWDQEVEE